MRTGDRSPAATMVAWVACALLGTAPAHAYDKATCAAAYEQAQKDRLDARLRLAHEQLLVCAHVTCPSVVAKDCRVWRNEVEAQMASVTVVARDARGAEVRDLKMFVDGELILEELDGKPIFLDAGSHELRYERHGALPVEQRIKLAPGERDRILEAKLVNSPTDRAPADHEGPRGGDHPHAFDQSSDSSSGAAVSGVSGERSPLSGAPPGTYVFGGVGLVALGAFTYFGLNGRADVAHLRETCAPACPKSDVDSARGELIAANISLGVGLASLGVAAVLWLSNHSASPRTATHFDFRPEPGGGVGALSGRF
jgi:hypothetical protein